MTVLRPEPDAETAPAVVSPGIASADEVTLVVRHTTGTHDEFRVPYSVASELLVAWGAHLARPAGKRRGRTPRRALAVDDPAGNRCLTIDPDAVSSMHVREALL